MESYSLVWAAGDGRKEEVQEEDRGENGRRAIKEKSDDKFSKFYK